LYQPRTDFRSVLHTEQRQQRKYSINDEAPKIRTEVRGQREHNYDVTSELGRHINNEKLGSS